MAHLYFKSELLLTKSNTGAILPGVDFIAEGGYVIAPPSVSLKGEYATLGDAAPASPTGNHLSLPGSQRLLPAQDPALGLETPPEAREDRCPTCPRPGQQDQEFPGTQSPPKKVELRSDTKCGRSEHGPKILRMPIVFQREGPRPR